MRYVFFITGDEDRWAAMPRAEAERGLGRLRAWEAEQRRAGAIVDGSELAPTGSATTVRRVGERVLVLDGPFAETKEAIGGYYLVDVPDLDAAISLARSSPFLELADIEIRPLIGTSRLEARAG